MIPNRMMPKIIVVKRIFVLFLLFFYCFQEVCRDTQFVEPIAIRRCPKSGFNFTLEDALLPGAGFEPKSSGGHQKLWIS